MTSEVVRAYPNPSVDVWKNYCLDEEKNFYLIHGEYFSKYDSAFNHIWTTHTDNGYISDIFYHPVFRPPKQSD